MAIPPEQAKLQLTRLQDARIDYLFAQAHAKHVLHEVGETQENFPKFDPDLDEKVTFTAYAMLSAGCSLAEQGDRPTGTAALEQAATQLEHIHGAFSVESRPSGFHVLIAALAFYAAGHYSRAFVAMRRVEGQTQAAQIIASFLRKEVESLIPRLNAVLLADIPEFEDQLELDEWVISVTIARSIALALEFIYTGDKEAHLQIRQQLSDAMIVASEGHQPGWWWIVRLLRLMFEDLETASPWRVLPSFFPPDSIESLGRYIRVLAFGKRPIAELWISQRAALPVALDQNNRGAVINLRTSGGKTRVAELAILQTLLAYPNSKVVYLAPFRSLALEIEQTISDTFSWLEYGVSHLYGGSRVSSVDTELASEAAIIIATPEKTRALFRAAPELFENIKLIIVDEGHLIGPSERYVRNEVFLDHLRCLARSTGARILLLSAVLPNPQELAEWIAGDQTSLVSSDWKPAAERFGVLVWNGSKVRINWIGKEKSFNPSFVETEPKDKNEAVAASAVRLSNIGPVMIFVAQARSVPTMARAVLSVLGENPEEHQWPVYEWRVFKAVCQEELEPNSVEFQAAQAGIICHSADLPAQVRMAMERLMRSAPPKIIVATTTLSQGVNIGISTVIVASTMRGQNDYIDKRDFWNICGRAGRAFSDGEGKVIYVIDGTKKAWQIKKEKERAINYLTGQRADPIVSGLLFCVKRLTEMAAQAGVDSDLLLGLAADNDFQSLGEKAGDFDKICDRLDDELLALHMDKAANPSGDEPILWIENVFRTSLAAIQARSGTPSSDDVLAFLRTRAESTLRRIPTIPVRKAIIASGLPLSVAVRVQNDLNFFKKIVDRYSESPQDLSSLCQAVQDLDGWFLENASTIADNKMPAPNLLDHLRTGWLGGVGLRQLMSKLHADGIDKKTIKSARSITTDFYGYRLPWVIHAASQQLRSAGDEERPETLDRIALLVELGVPSDTAARIFLAGVHSRAVATELSCLDTTFPKKISSIRHVLTYWENIAKWKSKISRPAAQWLDLLSDGSNMQRNHRPRIISFTFKKPQAGSLLHARSLSDRTFLCSTDGTIRIPVESTDQLPFDQLADDPRNAFIRLGDEWKLVVRDPRLGDA